MTNLSWNNSSRTVYYAEAYAEELKEIKEYVSENLLGGLKFITWEEIEFLLKLKWHEDSIKFLLRKDCHPSLNFYIAYGYVNIHCHTQSNSVYDRFFNTDYEASPPEELRWFNKFYNVVEFVRYLEVNAQLNRGLAVKASPHPEDLGFVPNLKENYYTILTPLTWESIERLPIKERSTKIKEENLDWRDLSYLLKKSQEEINLLLWGTNNSFEIEAIKKAKEGDTRAADALNLVF